MLSPSSSSSSGACVLCKTTSRALVVVSLDLEVRYPAVPLGCGNLAMPQEVLDGSKVSIGVEKLRGHGVAKPMTRDVQPALSRIAFDPLLDASNR